MDIRRVLAEGSPFAEIARLARLEQVDLVVMGSYSGQIGGVDKIFFGSTAEKVVRTAGSSSWNAEIHVPEGIRERHNSQLMFVESAPASY